MPLKDDKDEFISRSSQDALKSRDQVRQEKQMEKAVRKGKLSELQRNLLMQEVGEGVDMDAAQADEETKRLQKLNEEDEVETFGRKTADEMKLDSQQQLDADTLIALELLDEEEKQESEKEYHDDAA